MIPSKEEPKQRRYSEFILLNPVIHINDKGREGLNIIDMGISEEAAHKNSKQCCLIEGIYVTVMELFNLENIFFCTSGEAFYFSIPDKDYDNYHGKGAETRSPLLCRKKLLKAKPYEIAGAIIDLFLDRANWSHKISSSILNLD